MNKLKNIFIILGLFVTFYLIMIIPFENLFLRFDSPQASFNYSFQNKIIVKVINEKDCAVVIYENQDSSISYVLLVNDGNGWRINSPYMPLGISFRTWSQYTIVTGRFYGKDKIFISIDDLYPNEQGSTLKIVRDNRNSNFSNFQINVSGGGGDISYYTFVDAPLTDYYLFINNEKVSITD